MEQLNIPSINSKVFIFSPTQDDLLHIEEVYSLGPNSLKVQRVCLTNMTASSTTSCDLSNRLKYRRDLDGLEIAIVTADYKPFTASSGDGNISGICPDIVKQLSKNLNFTFTVREASNKGSRWGLKLKNGTWVGMMGKGRFTIPDK